MGNAKCQSPLAAVMPSHPIRSAARYWSGSIRPPEMTLKLHVVAPMPRASDSTATALNPGLAISIRHPYRRSCISESQEVVSERILLLVCVELTDLDVRGAEWCSVELLPRCRCQAS